MEQSSLTGIMTGSFPFLRPPRISAMQNRAHKRQGSAPLGRLLDRQALGFHPKLLGQDFCGWGRNLCYNQFSRCFWEVMPYKSITETSTDVIKLCGRVTEMGGDCTLGEDI